MSALDEARQRPDFGLVMGEAVRIAAQRAHTAEAKLAAIERVLADVVPPLGVELDHVGNEDREAAAYVEGVRTIVVPLRAILGEQPASSLHPEPVWSYTPEGHDDEYEYVVSADCDGSNRQAWRRTPERRVPRGDAERIPHLPPASTRRLVDPVFGEQVRS